MPTSRPSGGTNSPRPPRKARCRCTRRVSNPVSPPTTCPWCSSTQSSQIEKIHAYEIGLYDDYGVPDIMSDAMGFGRPLDYEPWIAMPGAISGEWQGQIRMVADALGVEVRRYVRPSIAR